MTRADTTIEMVTQRCLVCEKSGLLTISKSGYRQWVLGTKPLQDAFPELTDYEREQLRSGVHPKCFDILYPIEDEQG